MACEECPTYAECGESGCLCPECNDASFDAMVCGSDKKIYQSRCELRRTACSGNVEIFEVPLFECDPELAVEDELEGSGEFGECLYGGEIDERADIYDDEEYATHCICEWHCAPYGTPLMAEGVVFGGECELYRDGFCANQRQMKLDTERLCSCAGEIGVLDIEYCGSDGGCLCKPNFAGLHCERCVENYYLANGECAPCNCSPLGAHSSTCSGEGICQCREGYSGQKCEVEMPMEECDECARRDMESGIVCGDNYRKYSSICAMHRLHCRTPLDDRPAPITNVECTMPRSTSATTTPSASSTAIPTIAVPSNVAPTKEAEPIRDPYEDEGSGSGDESDDEDLAHSKIVVAPGKVVSSKVINPNLVSYDVKLFLRSKKPNHTAITDEFLLTLRNQFPTIKSVRNYFWPKEIFFKILIKVFFEITSTDNVDNAVVGKLRISPAIDQMEVMVNNFIEQSNGREGLSAVIKR